MPLLEILEADDDTLLDRYGVWYIPGREARYLRRNALIALGNSADGDDGDVQRAVVAALASADDVVRSHAVWAAKRLALDHLLAGIEDDPSPDVAAELARDVSPAS